jgi:hypothetical protein
MEIPELSIKINTEEATKKLSRIIELLKEVDALSDSVSEKLRNLTATGCNHQ